MTSKNDSHSSQEGEVRFASDLNLARAASGESVEAWHRFVNQYSGLIYSVIRHHLLTDDEDEIRSAYVDVLKSLYDGGLAGYRGESRLSTWLIVSTRSQTIDLFRKRHGRLRTPLGYDKLSELDELILRLFYVDRLPLEIVVHTLEWRGFSVDVDGIVEAIQRIERAVGRRYLMKLDDEFQARRHGVDSVRVLKYLVEQKLEYEEKQSATRADRSLLEHEARETTRRLREAVSKLAPEDRELLFLRFDCGLSAKRIADRLHLNNQRSVYSLIDRAVRKIREIISGGGK